MSLKDLVQSGEIRKHSAICQRQVMDLQSMMLEIGIDHLEGTLGWSKANEYAFEESPYYDLDGYRFRFVAHKPTDVTRGHLHARPICSSCESPILYQHKGYSIGGPMEDSHIHYVHSIRCLSELLERFPQPGWKCEACR